MPIQPIPFEDVNQRCLHIEIPVLAIIGGADADDHIRLARELLAQVPRGREVIIPDNGHDPNLEKPEPFNAAQHKCLDDLCQAPGLMESFLLGIHQELHELGSP